MDVLREIQTAEKQAEQIELDQKQKSEVLTASVAGELRDARSRMEGELEQELATLTRELADKAEKEKAEIQKTATAERAALEQRVRAAQPKAVAAILARLGL